MPVTNPELSRALGRALHRPAVLPVPALALKLLYGEMADDRAPPASASSPRRFRQLGYEFAIPSSSTRSTTC